MPIPAVAATIGSAFALLGFFAALGYAAYTRRLQLEEKKLEELPKHERARRTDEYLTRYGINAKGAPISEHLALIRDEVNKRHQRSLVYLIVIATVCVICFALAAVFNFRDSSAQASPTPKEKKTVFRLIDSATGDPIYRSLTVLNKLAGPSDRKDWALTPDHEGRFEVAGEPADVAQFVDGLQIDCPGYDLSHCYEKHPNGLVDLKLDRKKEGLFSDAVTPSEDEIQFISDEEYSREVKGQLKPAGNKVYLKCVNDTDCDITLLLYRQNVNQQAFADRPWSVLEPTCPKRRSVTYSIDETATGSVYYIFGSMLGLKATQLASGSLHGTTPPVLWISYDNESSFGPIPSLHVRLVRQE